MKRSFAIIIFICLLFLFSSCQRPADYEFLQEKEEVKEISVVEAYFENDSITSRLIEEELAKIKNIDIFLKDFHEVKCEKTSYHPMSINCADGMRSTVIKIHYQNGEYELIDTTGQSRYTLERGFQYRAGAFILDKEGFTELLDKYK